MTEFTIDDYTKNFFTGNIVVTDPCYIKCTVPPMSRGTIYGDWSCMVYPGSMEENQKYKEWDEHYLNFYHEYNFAGKTDEEKKTMLAEHIRFEDNWKDNILGQFCADSGQVGVFEWNKLTDSEKVWVIEHPRCAAVIERFNTFVTFKVVDRSLHVIGYDQDGTPAFFSVQSGF